MKNLSIHIVEDEQIIAMDLEDILKKMGHQVTDISMSFNEVYKKLETNRADLFLVDIHLKGDKSGIDVAYELEKRNIPHIYISSFTDPNIIARAKSTNAYGYIVKPFNYNDVFVAIEMASGRIAKEIAKKSTFINDGNGKLRVLLGDIMYAEADGNYTHLHLLTRILTLRNNLKSVHGSVLNDSLFKRVHKSFVVNTKQIERIVKNHLVLKNGTQIPLSKKTKPDLGICEYG